MIQRYRILSACDAFPYTIKFECAAGECTGECTAYLQSVYLLRGLVANDSQFYTPTHLIRSGGRGARALLEICHGPQIRFF